MVFEITGLVREEKSMPCYEVNLISVEFKAANLTLFALIEGARIVTRAGKSVGHWRGVEVDFSSAIARGKQEEINALKRQYSEVAIKQAAKAKSWSLTKTAINQFVAQKW